MIDFTQERPLSLAAVAERFDVTVKTVRCWARGVGGRRLETAKLGGKRFTSLEALQRFAVQATRQQVLPFDSLHSLRTDHEEAMRRLIENHGPMPRDTSRKKK